MKLKLAAAAKRAGVSRSTIHRAMKRGTLSFERDTNGERLDAAERERGQMLAVLEQSTTRLLTDRSWTWRRNECWPRSGGSGKANDHPPDERRRPPEITEPKPTPVRIGPGANQRQRAEAMFTRRP